MNKLFGEDLIDDYLNRINIEIDGIGHVLSMKILYPTDISLQSLTALLKLSDIGLIDEYKKLDTEFVDFKGEFYSLSFLKYNDAVKYASISNKEITNSVKPLEYPPIIPEAVINLNDEENITRLSNPVNVEPFWNRWVGHVKKYFPIGKSTLWSYAVLRRSKREIISSAYLIFSNDIGKDKAIVINKLCQDLLYEVIMELYVTELKRSEFEKMQLAREQMLYVGMGHYIKNSMKGLEEHEIEIIDYLKSKCSDNDVIVLKAQLQRLIYSLIELYLQMRQIAVSGSLNSKITNTKAEIKLYDFINLIYLHVIIARGRFYLALNKPESFGMVKATVIKQIENISKLTNLLRNDSFSQTEINSVLSDTSDIEHFYSLSKSGFNYMIKVDESLKQLKLNLNSIQFKYLYTVFTEIFDNCFNDKHSSNSRVAHLYLYQENNLGFKNIIVSSRDSSEKIEEKFKFKNEDLCNNCDSKGNGIKIIRSALTNEHLESELFYPVNSVSKPEKISDRRRINVYEYDIHLNNNLFI